ncbi:MAG: LamG domain-containing protein [Pseudomonadales bacterium]|nr:LamG domain-containing protein [Pseudomonadales bacterium]
MINTASKLTVLFIRAITILSLGAIISACGGGGSGTGASNDSVPQSGSTDETTTTPIQEYLNRESAPLPNDNDIQAFMTHFWNNVAADDRCGQCHDDTHEAPFARTDNINAAYSATTSLINRLAPQQSAIVTKVEGGHQCWETNDSACAQILTRWIQNWVNSGEGTGVSSTTIILEKPDEVDITSSKVLPADAPTEFDDLYDIATTYCAGCHSETAATSQQPFFASPNRDTAWDAIRTKIDLKDEPRTLAQAQSRLTVRLRSESHNCWSENCNDDAGEIHTAIQAIAAGIELDEIDEDLKISGGMILTEGTVASSGGRFEQHQIAFWNFSEGDGSTAFDTSGVEPAMHLSIDSGIGWVGGWGIEIGEGDGRAWSNTTSSKKLYDNIALSGEYSIEAWVAPANVTQEEAHIISYANGNEERNFTVSQTLYSYDFFQKTTEDEDGSSNLSTDADDEDLQATLQHVVLTYDRENGRRIYVNGEFTGDGDPDTAGFLTNWSDGYVFSIGNEPSNDRQWEGMVRMVAIHNRALDADQVLQNYDVGVGQKYYLLFDVSALVNIDDCYDSYIVYEAAQLDNYAYRFNNPFFARLYEADESGPAECAATEPPAQADYSFSVTDIRLGINGKVTEVGQAYRNVGRNAAGEAVGLTIDSASNADGYQQISDVGTVYAIENGPVEDLFFLSFARIVANDGEVLDGVITDPAAISVSNPLADESSDFGVRTFDEVNASMSEMTGIPTTNASVVSVYSDVKTQLPTTEVAESFLAAHQIAVAQMAITYCSELVDLEVTQSSGDRRFFTAFNFNDVPATAFADSSARDNVYDPLINMTVGTNLAAQPTTADVKANFDTLLDGYSGTGESRSGLLDCGSDCDATRTQTIVKSLCAASIGSAMMLIQ